MYRPVRTFLLTAALLLAAAPVALAQERHVLPCLEDTELRYLRTPVYRIECAEAVLHYQRKIGCPITMDLAVGMVEEARDRVMLYTGEPIGETVEVYFPEDILMHDVAPDANLTTHGIRFNYEAKNCVAFRRASLSVGLAAHELLHAWFRAHKIEPARWWIEEGACEAIEEADLFNSYLWEVLRNQGPMTLDELSDVKQGTNQEDRIRATAWLLCYHARYLNPNRLKLAEFVQTPFEELTDPALAFDEVMRHVERRRPQPPPPPAEYGV